MWSCQGLFYHVLGLKEKLWSPAVLHHVLHHSCLGVEQRNVLDPSALVLRNIITLKLDILTYTLSQLINDLPK